MPSIIRNLMLAAGFLFALAGAALAQNPMVGGAPMFADKNIVETLQSPGPFTVFAPVNAAFERLPAGTVETLLKPENKDALVKVLTSHVVAGKLSASDLVRRARANGGRYNMQSVSGAPLTAVLLGSNVYIFDQSGGAGLVTIADVNQSNGVIHVVNRVLLPRM